MTDQSQSLSEINRRAIEVLSRELGIVDTIRFVNQFTNGTGDYTTEREVIFANSTLEVLISEIKSQKETKA